MTTLATPTTGRRFVSIGVAAELAGCSPQTLRDMELRGEVPAAARIEGLGRRFYSLDDVEVIRQVREARKSGSRLSPAA
jgi:DNA-binding transcriptional MerR regulator